jgi:NADP-dependent 3-hydroxy acid dehydrogenase YdfG
MGAATARFLGAQGARLVLQGRDKVRLSAVAADAAVGGEAVTVELELENPAAAAGLIDQATAAFGEIHGLVLNASLFDPVPWPGAPPMRPPREPSRRCPARSRSSSLLKGSA